MTDANAQQRTYWNDEAGPVWVREQEALDTVVRPWGALALARAKPAAGERVLDIGCGCGDTSLALAAAVGRGGCVVGTDLSAPMLGRARERAADAEFAQVSFLEADAQRAAWEAAPFDLAFSRFGVMFFADPVAAFSNLARALRPGGRLAFVCWQSAAANPWATVPVAAVARVLPAPEPPAPGAPGPFALGDPDRLRAILAEAGFSGIELVAAERTPVWGEDVDAATAFFQRVGRAGGMLAAAADVSLRERAVEALRAGLAEAADAEGRVALGAAGWVVHARRE